MTTRMNLSVDDDIPQMLATLAGPRGKGELVSQLVRNAYESREVMPDVEGMSGEALRLMVLGMGGQVKALEGQVQELRSQLAAVVAKLE